MSYNSREVIGGFAGLLLVTGIMILIPLLPALVYAEYSTIPFFLIPGIVAIILGMFLNSKYPLAEDFSIKATIIIACTGWLFVSLIGMIPYFLIGMGVLDAFFESVSGFTTTGMSLINNVEIIPKSILFWRSFTQWIGGVGIILFFTILLKGGISTWRLYVLEGREKFTPSVKASVKNILLIYSFLTGVCALILYMCGLDAFDAINHAMTTLSTGGFSTKNTSMAEFGINIKLTISFFMVLGATSFVLFYNLGKLDVRKIVEDAEFKTMIFVLLFGGLLVSVFLLLNGIDMFNGIVDGFFNVISILTTTGYTSANLDNWPSLTKAILIILMFIGGSAGSTAGGIKVWRFVVLFRIVRREIEKLVLPPSAIIPVKIGGRVLDDEYIIKISALVFSYVLFVFVSFVLLSFSIPDLFGALSLVVSALSNVGPAFYPVNQLDLFSKSVLIVAMWAGRLELLPVIAFIGKEIPSIIKEHYSRSEKKAEVLKKETPKEKVD
ncbi:MAG: TrkH family potassium uptake protein [Candidatus Methanomethyliaceae archaeon]|nr:TrkH family potassium uptake protein [Candidatus Methanomethyliaceae archaeon]